MAGSRWLGSPRWAVAGSVLLLLTGGCVKVVNKKVAKFYNGTAPTTQPVPETGVYKVKVACKGEKEYKKIPGTFVMLRNGDEAGFHVDEAGKVYATVGRRMVALDLPADWDRLMWHTSYKKETQFSKEVKEGVAGTAKVTGLVAGAFIEGTIEGLVDDDDDDRRDSKEEKKRRAREQELPYWRNGRP